MILVGCDFHSRYQQIACVDMETGDLMETRLEHENGDAFEFYRSLKAAGRVGVEATRSLQWFARMLNQLGHQLVVGDAAKIRAMVVRRQKTDSRDASHLLELLMNNSISRSLGTKLNRKRSTSASLASPEVRMDPDLGKEPIARLGNGSGCVSKKQAVECRRSKTTENLILDPWAGHRRDELLRMLDQLGQSIEQLSAAVEEAGQDREDVRRLLTHPGVGRIVALAFSLTIGPVDRFPSSKQLVSYLGLNPREHSSGGRQKFGAISKQGNRLMRTLLVEAAQTAARVEPTLRRQHQHLKFPKASAVAKVAIARKLAVRLYWMLRSKSDYAELVRMQGSSGANLVDLHPSISCIHRFPD